METWQAGSEIEAASATKSDEQERPECEGYEKQSGWPVRSLHYTESSLCHTCS